MTNRWKLDYKQVLASSKGVAVLEVDGRGTKGKGDSWQEKLRQNIGEADVEDHIMAVRQVKCILIHVLV